VLEIEPNAQFSATGNADVRCLRRRVVNALRRFAIIAGFGIEDIRHEGLRIPVIEGKPTGLHLDQDAVPGQTITRFAQTRRAHQLLDFARFFVDFFRLATFFFALRRILMSASIRLSTGSCRFAFRLIQTSASRRLSTWLSFFAMKHARPKGNGRHLPAEAWPSRPYRTDSCL
jgi:hypothetical protein